eukprot:6183842-Pleurochrysis_carterae.AAC.1
MRMNCKRSWNSLCPPHGVCNPKARGRLRSLRINSSLNWRPSTLLASPASPSSNCLAWSTRICLAIARSASGVGVEHKPEWYYICIMPA